jgi:hypothetical protein
MGDIRKGERLSPRQSRALSAYTRNTSDTGVGVAARGSTAARESAPKRGKRRRSRARSGGR